MYVRLAVHKSKHVNPKPPEMALPESTAGGTPDKALAWIQQQSSAGFGLVSEDNMKFVCDQNQGSCQPPSMPNPAALANLKAANFPVAFINWTTACDFTAGADQDAAEKRMQSLLITVSSVAVAHCLLPYVLAASLPFFTPCPPYFL